MGQGLVGSFGGLVTCRALMGVFESGFVPGEDEMNRPALMVIDVHHNRSSSIKSGLIPIRLRIFDRLLL